ncbi:type II secretion system protein [Acetobacterium tundrae]|uniref:Prepilin-type N-terminal cleavage/methylation domain-containing protein n=1 Tax=Acetobacterium tundrae TaxID=132932 RepID=A0ABR6WKY1_9FIRM|nr:prepilin-type N-terminal cleavage/methylation domain-containing protein [Acetobacterium tundrae]MBC3796782.1 prepilin-type N-terminal cleavage/methylation domain-containing protein [Acetobacterium tundrae]
MEFINRMRKDKKGFTLIEIIVVLVILAILAAFMIPSMLGFVGDAKKKAAVAEQREVYVAAQAIATEQFGKNGNTTGATNLGMSTITSPATDSVATNLGSAACKSSATGAALEMYNYLNKDITPGTGLTSSDGSLWTVSVDANGKVTKVTYKKGGLQLDDLSPSSAVN